MESGTCLNCQRIFHCKRSDSKFCSNACKQAYYRILKGQEEALNGFNSKEDLKCSNLREWFQALSREEKIRYLVVEYHKGDNLNLSGQMDNNSRILNFLLDTYRYSKKTDWIWALKDEAYEQHKKGIEEYEAAHKKKNKYDFDFNSDFFFGTAFTEHTTGMLPITKLSVYPEVIKAGCKALAKKYHPDVVGGDSEKMKEITQILNSIK